MKAIMYHYIHDDHTKNPYKSFLHMEDFKRQLDFFETNYGIMKKSDFLDGIKNKQFKNSSEVILTFDDGLKDHYQFVFPELNQRGLWGIFFIPSYILHFHDLLDVHKLHIIISYPEGQKLLKEALNYWLDKNLNETALYPELYKYQQNEDDIVQMKKIINYFLPIKYREKLLNNVLELLHIDTSKAAEQHYMSYSELSILQQNGMIIGSHSISHNILSRLSEYKQHQEIINSFNDIFTTFSNTELKIFSFPYGRDGTFNEKTLKILSKSNYDCAFMVKHDEIQGNVSDNLFCLPRWDCNQFPFGKIRK